MLHGRGLASVVARASRRAHLENAHEHLRIARSANLALLQELHCTVDGERKLLSVPRTATPRSKRTHQTAVAFVRPGYPDIGVHLYQEALCCVDKYLEQSRLVQWRVEQREEALCSNTNMSERRSIMARRWRLRT